VFLSLHPSVKVGNFQFKALGDISNHFYMTLKELSNVFGATEDTLNKSINRNIDEFELGIDYGCKLKNTKTQINTYLRKIP
jgi:hypothetical protein